MRWLALALFLALCGALIAPHLPIAAPRAPLCSDSAQQIEKARSLLQQGLEQAMIEHTTKLFRVWLSAGGDGRENAAEGLRNEVRGFFHAQDVIDAWVIPPCKKP